MMITRLFSTMWSSRLVRSFRPSVALFTSTMYLSSEVRANGANPLFDFHALPRFKDIKPEHVQPALDTTLSQLKTDFTKLEGSIIQGSAKDYHTVVEEMERIQAPLTFSWGIVNHLMGVNNSEELRKAHQAVQPSVVHLNQELGQSQALYQCLNSIKRNPQMWDSLQEPQQRIINASIRDMQKSGVGLSSAERAVFNQFQLEVSELSTKFSNNVLDSTKVFKLTLESADEVKGLPPSAKALLAKQAVTAGYADVTAEKGPWVVTLDMPSYLACMQHMQDRSIREKIYRAYVTRASSGDSDNSEIISQILRKKRAMAKMLGYNSFADMSLASKMAPNVETVLRLLDMLREKSLPAAREELDALKEFARKQGFTEEMSVWDVPFWSERLRESQYEFEEEQLRVYFPLEGVLTGLFSLAQRLFAVRIVAADGETDVWHPDVRYFKIYDVGGSTPIAAFYLDPFSRPAEKRGGAWMATCTGKSKVMGTIPVAYLTCNGSPPVDGKPSLMTFREVETLFHEFGHGLQHMLTRVEDGDAAGINNIEWDAVELPSQFMENWCYDKQTLHGFARHYQTGEVIPDELFEKVKAAKNFNAGLAMMRQLYFGVMDLRLHSTYDPAGDQSPFDVQRSVASVYSVMPPLNEDRFLCSFSHIFAGGYAAGYYSYKWAEVMSADAFSAFEEAGLDNDTAVRETGRRFRETVLSLGGGKHPGEVFRLFRGKDPSPDALLRHSGLAKTCESSSVPK